MVAEPEDLIFDYFGLVVTFDRGGLQFHELVVKGRFCFEGFVDGWGFFALFIR